jgi:hypothetical protein
LHQGYNNIFCEIGNDNDEYFNEEW